MMVRMQIYLLRHGIAEFRSASGADADRELTDEGRHKVADIAKVAARAGVNPSLVISSPYRRAWQTAQIAARVLGYEREILQSAALTPPQPPEGVWDELRTHRTESGILLVGHEPLFSALGGYLLGAPELNIDFKKGALLALETNEFRPRPRAILKWLLTAKLAA